MSASILSSSGQVPSGRAVESERSGASVEDGARAAGRAPGQPAATTPRTPGDPFFVAPVAAEREGKCVTPLPSLIPPGCVITKPRKLGQRMADEIAREVLQKIGPPIETGSLPKKIESQNSNPNSEKGTLQKNSESKSGVFFLILDETLMQYFRRPRSRKRRIQRKWRARAENYRPHPCPVGECVMLGRLAILWALPGQLAPNYQYPVLRLHPATWAKWLALHPELEAMAIIRTDREPLGVSPWAPRVPFKLLRKRA